MFLLYHLSTYNAFFYCLLRREKQVIEFLLSLLFHIFSARVLPSRPSFHHITYVRLYAFSLRRAAMVAMFMYMFLAAHIDDDACQEVIRRFWQHSIFSATLDYQRRMPAAMRDRQRFIYIVTAEHDAADVRRVAPPPPTIDIFATFSKMRTR